MNHTSIRSLLAAMTQHARAKDVDGIMSNFHPSALSFEFGQQATGIGVDQIRQNCERGYSGIDGEFSYEFVAERIVEGADVGYCFGAERIAGQSNGTPFNATVLITYGLQKFDSYWLITHQHLSTVGDS